MWDLRAQVRARVCDKTVRVCVCVCVCGLFVEFVLLLALLDVVLVALLEVLGEHDVAILAHRLHARLLANGVDVGARDLVRPRHIVLQVDLVAQIHLGRYGGEDQTLLASIGQRKLDLAVETARSQERRVERVRSIRGHDDLDVDRLIEAVHLVEQLEQNALHLAVGAGLRVEALRRNRIYLVDEDDGGRVLFGQAKHVAHHARTLAQILLHELGADDSNKRCCFSPKNNFHILY